MNILKKMFSKTGIIAITCISFSVASAQKAFVIKGDLGKDKHGKVRIYYQSENEYIIDSTQAIDGHFVLKGKIGDPTIVQIVLNPSNPKALQMTMESINDDKQSFFLEKGTTIIKGNEGIKTAIITGGKTQKDYTYIMNLNEPLNKKGKEIRELGKKYIAEQNDSAIASFKKETELIKQQKIDIDSSFVANNQDSYLAFLMSFKMEIKGKPIEPKIDESRFNHFSKRVRNSEAGKKIATRIAIAKKIDIGMPAPDFTLNDTIGKPIKLSSLKGKYVLIWFWHSMVMGFDSEIFNINKAYKKIDNKNFVILGVSYERQAQMSDDKKYEPEVKANWKKVISENKMNWFNVTDYGGIIMHPDTPVSSVAKAYDLNYSNVPQCILVDPNGRIVLKTSADKELTTKIKKIIGE